MDRSSSTLFRRHSPRKGVETLCSEFQGGLASHGIVTDLSIDGLHIQRPFGKQFGRTIPIEFEIPEVDEVLWAVGEVRFDEVKRAPQGIVGGLGGLVRHTGLRLVHAAERHRRILREYVMDTREVVEDKSHHRSFLMMASCYR